MPHGSINQVIRIGLRILASQSTVDETWGSLDRHRKPATVLTTLTSANQSI